MTVDFGKLCADFDKLNTGLRSSSSMFYRLFTWSRASDDEIQDLARRVFEDINRFNFSEISPQNRKDLVLKFIDFKHRCIQILPSSSFEKLRTVLIPLYEKTTYYVEWDFAYMWCEAFHDPSTWCFTPESKSSRERLCAAFCAYSPSLQKKIIAKWPSLDRFANDIASCFNLDLFKEAPPYLKNHKGLISKLFKENANVLQFASNAVKEDADFFLALIHPWDCAPPMSNRESSYFSYSFSDSPAFLQHASILLRSNKSFVLEAVQMNGNALQYASETLKEDREVVLAAAQQNESALKYASEALRKDKAFMLETVSLLGKRVLAFTPDSLRHDIEFIAAIESVERSFLNSRNLKDDRSHTLRNVRRNGLTICLASEDLRADREIALAAIAQNRSAFGYISKTLKENRIFITNVLRTSPFRINGYYYLCKKMILEILSLHGDLFDLLPKDLQEDEEIALFLIRQNAIALKNLPEILREDREFVLRAVDCNGLVLCYTSEDFRNDKEIVLAAVKQNAYAFQYAPETLKKDSAFVLTVVEQNGCALEFASSDLKNDKEIVLAAVRQNVCAFQYASAILKKNRALVLEVIKINGLALQYVPETFQADKKIVLAATIEGRWSRDTIRNGGEPLKFAAEALRGSKEFVLPLIKHNKNMFRYVSDTLRKDRQFVLELMKLDPKMFRYSDIFQYCSESLREDRKFVQEAVCITWQILKYVSEPLKSDRKILLAAVKNDADSLEDAPKILREDRNFILEAVRINGSALKYASEALKGDREIVLAAVKENGYSLKHASEALRGDRRFFLEAVRINKSAVDGASDILCKNGNLGLEIVRINGLALGNVLWHLRGFYHNEREITLAAVTQNGLALKHAEKTFTEDREIVLAAIAQNGSAFQFASDTLKKNNAFISDIINRNRSNRALILEIVKLHGDRFQSIPRAFQRDKEIALAAIKQNKDALQFVPSILREDPMFQTEAISLVISRKSSTYGLTLYQILPIPETFAVKLEEVPDDQQGTWEHLLREDLPMFLQSLTFETRPSSLQSFRTPASFKAQLRALEEQRANLESRLVHHTAFLGTPSSEDRKAVDAFYTTIKTYLNGIDGWCKAHPITSGSEHKEERIQILDAASVCGGGFLAQFQQLFSLLCLNDRDIEILLAARLSTQAARSIEAIIHAHFPDDPDVHQINIVQWQLQHYLGRRIEKDTIVEPWEDEFGLMFEFLTLHTPERLVNDLCEELKTNEGLAEKFADFVVSSEFAKKYATFSHLVPQPPEEEVIESYKAVDQDTLKAAQNVLLTLPEVTRKEVMNVLAQRSPEIVARQLLRDTISKEIIDSLIVMRKSFQQLGDLKLLTGMPIEKLQQCFFEEDLEKKLLEAAREPALIVQADANFTAMHKENDSGILKPSGVAIVLTLMGFMKAEEVNPWAL